MIVRILRRTGRHVRVDLVDDLDGTEAGETICFELDGRPYEIELSERNALSFRQAFTPYIDQARPPQGYVA